MAFTLKKIVLIITALLSCLIHGRPTTPPHTVRRMVVVQQGKLGDMICTTPVFRALREAYPDAHIAVVGNRVNQDVLVGNPHVDAYHASGSLKANLKLLKEGKYDCGIVTNPDIVSVASLIIAGIPCVIAPSVAPRVSPLADGFYRFLVSFVITRPHEEGHYAPSEYLRLLEPLGITATDTTKVLRHTDEAARTVDAFLAELGKSLLLVAMTPSAGNTIKEWPPERFARVADHLISTYGATVIVVGTKGEKAKIDSLLTNMQSQTGVVDAGGRFSVEELKALIARLDLFIAADTGPVYIAEAFDVPTIDIVGPVDERIQPPIGPRHRVLVPPAPRIPQVTVLNAKWYDEREARRQAEATTIEEVIREVDDLLRLTARP